MTRLETLSLCLLTALLASACGSEDRPKDAPSGERTVEPEPEVPKDAPAGPFADFDFEAAKAAWQGSWVLDGDIAGKKVAWMIDGESLTMFDGEQTHELEFSIYSPCRVSYTDTAAGLTTYPNFLFVGDTLHTGLGASGVVVNDAVVACIGSKTYVLRGETCEAWSELFDDWKSEPATCEVTGEGEARKLVADGQELPFVSETGLAAVQLRRRVAVKYPNFEAAKSALTELATPADPAPAP